LFALFCLFDFERARKTKYEKRMNCCPLNAESQRCYANTLTHNPTQLPSLMRRAALVLKQGMCSLFDLFYLRERREKHIKTKK
jgi:hypothetical protein